MDRVIYAFENEIEISLQINELNMNNVNFSVRASKSLKILLMGETFSMQLKLVNRFHIFFGYQIALGGVKDRKNGT